ncbi:lipoate--protein ligase family protein [bacterium]|nr:MAG: lipoate--protein ligase family protein [bacterium]
MTKEKQFIADLNMKKNGPASKFRASESFWRVFLMGKIPLFGFMQFRLVLDSPQRGAYNMAADETLLRRNATAQPLPTLRFYAWDPFCLSLGRLQKTLPPGALLPENERDFDVVRRPTGGRAVWHAQEITYSICAPLDFLPENARSVQGAYEWLSGGFLLGLQSLGVQSSLAPSQKRGEGGTNCFASSAACDFLVNGKKLIGAAQCRLEGAFLQHGSLLLSMNPDDWQQKTGGPMSGATSLAELGVHAPRHQIIAALCDGFERACAVSLMEGNWSEEEREQTQQLAGTKYLSPEWTLEAIVPPDGI